MTNRNEETGIHYGYVAANDLDQDVVHELMYGSQARNLSQEQALKEEEARQRQEFEDALEVLGQHVNMSDIIDGLRAEFEPNLDDFDPQIEEPSVVGIHEGVHYSSSWLGGALNFFITYSPHITHYGKRASPCVPGACILPSDMEAGTETGYDVPPEWYQGE